MLSRTKEWPQLASVFVAVVLVQAPLVYLLLRVTAASASNASVSDISPLVGMPVPEGRVGKAENISTAKEIRFPNSGEQGLKSSEWAPLIINSECKPGMPSYWAPCIAERRSQIEIGEELVYPDFSIAEPQITGMKNAKEIFQKDAYKQLERAHAKDGRSYRQGLRGQNFIIANGRYTNGRPSAKWGPQACTSFESDLKDLLVPDWNSTKATSPYAILATSPDNWSFQHFLDRVTRIIEQSAHLLPDSKRGVTVVTGSRAPGAGPKLMYEKYGFRSDQVVSGGPVIANRFVYSCRVPLVHPYMALRGHERIVGDLPKIPLSEKKVVLFLSREGASHGRNLKNEKALIESIRTLLEQRNKSEVLRVIAKPEKEDFEQLVKFLYTNVTALIGAHGGAMYNHRFCGLDSLVIEIMPSTNLFHGIWEEAMSLGQNYWMPIFPGQSGHNVEANVPQIIDIFKSQLGKPASNSPVLSHYDKYRKFRAFG
ncbi:hypothetical protein ACHAXT_001866 [Thalassiosira profunda]